MRRGHTNPRQQALLQRWTHMMLLVTEQRPMTATSRLAVAVQPAMSRRLSKLHHLHPHGAVGGQQLSPQCRSKPGAAVGRLGRIAHLQPIMMTLGSARVRYCPHPCSACRLQPSHVAPSLPRMLRQGGGAGGPRQQGCGHEAGPGVACLSADAAPMHCCTPMPPARLTACCAPPRSLPAAPPTSAAAPPPPALRRRGPAPA